MTLKFAENARFDDYSCADHRMVDVVFEQTFAVAVIVLDEEILI